MKNTVVSHKRWLSTATDYMVTLQISPNMNVGQYIYIYMYRDVVIKVIVYVDGMIYTICTEVTSVYLRHARQL